ncbi:unnamed protein product [Ceutorhynchus assimilis]|uniref:Uncharacterized protein n=1 Tax=Ceutorhynchus assimilis TaxID=467358 RepID=A0A9N9QG43_9CUCU|nr:unnamed protein product [Ceutorhynchus assimilis]
MTPLSLEKRCTFCRKFGHTEDKYLDQPNSNSKFHKYVTVNNKPPLAYVGLGSSCGIICLEEAQRLNLDIDNINVTRLYGYGNGRINTIGTIVISMKIDEVEATITAHVVPNSAQEIPILLGRNFTEQKDILMIKDDVSLKIFRNLSPHLPELEPDLTDRKVVLRISSAATLMPNTL